MIRALLAVFLLVGCATPTPPPVPPGPTPDDPFRGAIVDCASPEVAAQAVGGEEPIRSCLAGEGTTACLLALYPEATINTVACTVRDVGNGANFRVLAGQPQGDDTTVDSAARAWIQQEGIGYRSVQR